VDYKDGFFLLNRRIELKSDNKLKQAWCALDDETKKAIMDSPQRARMDHLGYWVISDETYYRPNHIVRA
jgi:hypothetical protein